MSRLAEPEVTAGNMSREAGDQRPTPYLDPCSIDSHASRSHPVGSRSRKFHGLVAHSADPICEHLHKPMSS
jgi:hypothetical protein